MSMLLISRVHPKSMVYLLSFSRHHKLSDVQTLIMFLVCAKLVVDLITLLSQHVAMNWLSV